MPEQLTPQEENLLQEILRQQKPCPGQPLDFSLPGLRAQPRPASAAELAQSLREFLGWPQWVRLYAKPALAVVAASKLARAQGKPGGVLWVAPGTGAPFEPPCGPSGLAMLRCEWAPGPSALKLAVQDLAAQDLLVVVDEWSTGLRLARGGACQYFGITPQMALYGPPLAGGADFAALAGLGPEPPAAKAAPAEPALAAAMGVLDLARELDLAERCQAWGRALTLGLDWLIGRLGMAEQVGWEGPAQLPRLKGKRLWAFLELCREEGLGLAPLVHADPGLDPGLAPELLWPRLARALIRLRVLPVGEKAPLGWSEAHQMGSCSKGNDFFQGCGR